jgi:hypothetical protein
MEEKKRKKEKKEKGCVNVAPLSQYFWNPILKHGFHESMV